MLLTALGLACRLLLAGVFLVSAYGKVRTKRSRRAFAVTVHLSTGLPLRWSPAAARIVIAAEAATAVLLLIPATAATGAVAAALLLAAFTAVVLRILRRDLGIACNCAGLDDEPARPHLLVRNGLLLLTAALAFLAAFPATRPGDGTPAPLVACALVIALTGTGAFRYWNQLAALARPPR